MSKSKAKTKSEIVKELSEKAALTRKQVGAIFDGLTDIIKGELGKKGPGIFTLPGLVKIKRVFKPAQKERQGINPFTKEPATFAAKPARNVVKAVALKSLKEMVK